MKKYVSLKRINRGKKWSEMSEVNEEEEKKRCNKWSECDKTKPSSWRISVSQTPTADKRDKQSLPASMRWVPPPPHDSRGGSKKHRICGAVCLIGHRVSNTVALEADRLFLAVHVVVCVSCGACRAVRLVHFLVFSNHAFDFDVPVIKMIK